MEKEQVNAGQVTLAEIYELHEKKGLELVIEDGAVTQIVTN